MAGVLRIGDFSDGTPKSVEQITSDAEGYEFDATEPLRYWLRTAKALSSQAKVYMSEGNDEMTYFLLFRHAHLVLTNLPTHPEEKKFRAELKTVRQDVNLNLQTLDVLRPKIKKRYEEYEKVAKQREARRQEARKTSQRYDSQEQSSYQRQAPVHRLHGHENEELAARLAHQEFSRRAPIPQSSSRYQQGEGDDLSRRLQAVRARVDPSSENLRRNDAESKTSQINSTGYSYPTVPAAHARADTARYVSRPPPQQAPPIQLSPPSLPPKPIHVDRGEAPPRPEKVASVPTPAAEKSETKAAYTFAPGGKLENGAPLRTIFLPSTLRTTFLRIAHANTVRNLETCGFLAGTVRANALFVSALVVPSQTATSDTCEMTNESELFDYVDSHELLVFGWIHTHPTQTCFMSSRDLHTHAGYQRMLAESVAIVCAPSKGDTTHGGDWGVYRLTDPPGQSAILRCEKPGIFHPHDVDNIYTDAMRPGHVMEIKDMDFEVVDLRNK